MMKAIILVVGLLAGGAFAVTGKWEGRASVSVTSSDGQKLVLNKMTSLLVSVKKTKENQKIKLVGFDAWMPDHQHGMVVNPVWFEQEEGLYRVDGVKLHMAGEWEFKVKLSDGKKSQVIFLPYKL